MRQAAKLSSLNYSINYQVKCIIPYNSKTGFPFVLLKKTTNQQDSNPFAFSVLSCGLAV